VVDGVDVVDLYADDRLLHSGIELRTLVSGKYNIPTNYSKIYGEGDGDTVHAENDSANPGTTQKVQALVTIKFDESAARVPGGHLLHKPQCAPRSGSEQGPMTFSALVTCRNSIGGRCWC
jgi:hypothetical protein